MHVTALAGDGVDALAFDPGLLPGTGLAREYGPVARAVWTHVLPRIVRLVPFASTPARSGALLADLAAAPVPTHPPGTYVEIDRVRDASPLARDRRAATELMRETAALVGRAVA